MSYFNVSSQTDNERTAEAKRILDMGLGDATGNMTPAEAKFVCDTLERFEQYEEKTFISPKQLFWLRDLKEKYL